MVAWVSAHKPNTNCNYHEVPCGKYIADVLRDGHVYEIQTKGLYRLAEKIAYYRAAGYRVTIVYPVFVRRDMRWIDPETGEVGDLHRLPRRGTLADFLAELLRLPHALDNEGVDFLIYGVAVEEEKLLDGQGRDKKRHATRISRRITAFYFTKSIRTPQDLFALLPEDLPPVFTVREFRRAAKCYLEIAQIAVRTLTQYDVLSRDGKRGNAYLYRVHPLL